MQEEKPEVDEEATPETKEQRWAREKEETDKELTESFSKLPFKSEECREKVKNLYVEKVTGPMDTEEWHAATKALLDQYEETTILEDWKASRKKNLGDNDPLFKEEA